jgi:hypothetical protein
VKVALLSLRKLLQLKLQLKKLPQLKKLLLPLLLLTALVLNRLSNSDNFGGNQKGMAFAMPFCFSWPHGFMVSWLHSFMASRFHGRMV